MDTGEWLAFLALPAFVVGAWVVKRHHARRLRELVAGLPVTKRARLELRSPRWSGVHVHIHWPREAGVTTSATFRDVRHGVSVVLSHTDSRLELPRATLVASAGFLLPAALSAGHELGALVDDGAPLRWRWWSAWDSGPSAAWLDRDAAREACMALERLAGAGGVRVTASRKMLHLELRARVDDPGWLDRALTELPRIAERLASAAAR